MSALATLLLASLCLLAAHVIRASRVALLLPAGAARARFPLLLALAIGYAIDALVPFRPGEAVRAWVVSRRTALPLSRSLALVGVERIGDVLVVAAILAWADPDHRARATVFAALGAVALGLAVAVAKAPAARRLLWAASAPLAEPLRLGIADGAWRLGEIVTGGALLRPRYIERTALMWSLYLLSYALLARAGGIDPAGTIAILLAAPLHPIALTILRDGGAAGAAMLAYVAAPLVAVLGYGAVRHRALAARLLAQRGRHAPARRGAGDRFAGAADYHAFLRAMFAGRAPALAGLGLRALDDGRLHRLLPGGSEAVTALVEVEGRLVVRKFATGAAGEKLARQTAWLRDGAGGLPLAGVVAERRGEGFHAYDMPIDAAAIGFHDYVHIAPPERGLAILDAVIARIDALHRATAAPADPAAIAAYLETKAAANARVILDFARAKLPERHSVNGRALSLAAWDVLLDRDWLGAQIRRPIQTAIHGDLTMENIVVAPGSAAGWYVIDPNPGNLFDSPLLDWAKLMQSLHYGYETIAHGPTCVVEGTAIRLPIARSEIYAMLHRRLIAAIGERLAEGALREILFHEIVHYCRLIPYRMRRSPEEGLRFFACASLLLDDYRAAT